MIHSMHQLLAPFGSLLFGAGQGVYSGLTRAFPWKTAACRGGEVDEG